MIEDDTIILLKRLDKLESKIRALEGRDHIDTNPLYLPDDLYLKADDSHIYFGASSDVNLYRGGSNALHTDNALVIDQKDASYAKPVLYLNQSDIDDNFIDFRGTTATDKSRSISTAVIGSFTYTGMFRIAINGTQRWIPYYA